MTDRDFFAASVAQGMCAPVDYLEDGIVRAKSPKAVAAWARAVYELADALGIEQLRRQSRETP